MSKAIARHLADITNGNVSKTNVIGIRKALNAAWKREHWRWKQGPRVEDVAALHNALADHEPRVCYGLHDTGVALLRSPRYRKRLESVRHIIDGLHMFRLVRFDEVGRGTHVPVYRAVSYDGESFLFRNIAWQTASSLGVESGPTLESE